MSKDFTIREGQVLTGPLFNEPMRVETVQAGGNGTLTLGLVGTQSERFRKVSLSSRDLEGLTVLGSGFSFDGDGHLLWLGLQAYSLGIAWEFDPYFGLSISRVDPLPHQLEAVYDYLLKLARVRFLLADDAGAGKTIMAGLLIRELQLRGMSERILVICPANLSFQWQRELKEKFDEKFLVLKGGDIRDQFGVNQWLEQKKVITSLDLAKREEILPGLKQVRWDLIIVDEAHRMSWTPPARKTARYALGELLRDTSDHFVLLITQFGGGKTHTLTALYHLATSGAKAKDYAGVEELLKAAGLDAAPKAKVAAFVGNAWDPQKGRETPWIDVAWQLAGEKGVKELGEAAKTTPPGTDALVRVFKSADAPVLLLFDEVLNFLNRHRGMADHFHAFIQNLTVATTATTHGAAVISLPRSQVEMSDWDVQWQDKITKVVRRVAKDLSRRCAA